MLSTLAVLPDAKIAIMNVNQELCAKGCDYAVVANLDRGSKEPVFLQLKYLDGRIRNIGVIHLVHLTHPEGTDWDALPFEKLARTTKEVGSSILARIALFFDAETRGLHIDEKRGTIYDFGALANEIKVHANNTFSINDKIVTWDGRNLPLNAIVSEGIIEFRRLADGDIELVDKIDQRVGKGIFINQNQEIYRK